MRPHALIAATCLSLLTPFAPLGCAGEQTADASAPAESPPLDFTLSFTVLSPGAPRAAAAVPRDRRPAHFVMETDWVLRSYQGRVTPDHAFPPETRQLTAQQVQSLWLDLRSAGLLDPDGKYVVGRPPSPETSEPTWVIIWVADGVRRVVSLPAEAQAPARALLNDLADLAWMPK